MEAMTGIGLNERFQELYQDYYEDGDSEWRRRCAVGKAAVIASLCDGLGPRSVLEIGAGEGSILRCLSERSFAPELYALEISPTGAQAILDAGIPGLRESRVFDGYNVPYEDGRFDLAILSHVVEHVEHPRQLIYEASRVARRVFIEVPLEDTARMPRDFVLDPVGHINFYSMKSIRRLVQSCGLRVTKETITTPARRAYEYRSGRKGLLAWTIKETLLRAMPKLATLLSTYHGALLCERAPRTEVVRGGMSREYSKG
jgi:SAM-dependent methyltransferase